MKLGVGLGLPYGKLLIPNFGQSHYYDGTIEGGFLIDKQGGINIPVVSGSGATLVLDMSVIDDSDTSIYNKANIEGGGTDYEWWNEPGFTNYGDDFYWGIAELNYRFAENLWIKTTNLNQIFAALTYSGGVLQGLTELFLFDSENTTTVTALLDRTFYAGITSIVEDNLIAAWTMQDATIQGDIIVDASKNGKNITNFGGVFSTNKLAFNGIDQYATSEITIASGAKSINLKLNLKDASDFKRPFYLGSGIYIQTIAGVLRLYVGGSYFDLESLSAGEKIISIYIGASNISVWINNVKVVDNQSWTGVNSTTGQEYARGSGIRYTEMDLYDFRMYNVELAASKAIEYYQEVS